jgi:hypothetical protein
LTATLKILEAFEPISLKEMDNVKLMNRTDTKFIFSSLLLDDVMAEAHVHYRLLEIEGKRLCRYETLYYDTLSYNLYNRHHQGKLNRYKIRHRTYVDSHSGFLEVKFKNNKGRTIKTRISKQDVPLAWENESESFLLKTLPFEPKILTPVIWVNYQRCTLVNRKTAERVTLDLELEFVKNGLTEKLDHIVIAEVKQDKRKASPFMDIMKKHHIREGGMSKYCMGIALTTSEVKINNFKSRLKQIKNKNYAEHLTDCE